jgi:phosphoenolpyruvate carboxylase
LGKTPFFKKQKPTPYDEAMSLVWYLENVFYRSAGKIYTAIKNQLGLGADFNKPLIQMGFWPGGDRDGNPFVVAETTLKVASALRGAIIKCYYMDVRSLKRRLTFAGIEPLLTNLENELYNNIFIPGQTTKLSKEEIINTLTEIREIIIHQHNGLFVHLVDQLINRVQIFGLYFASLDIRQESSVHGKVLRAVASKQKIKNFAYLPDYDLYAESNISDELVNDTLETIKAIKSIQKNNGDEGCQRYIISQCSSATNVMEVFQLFMLCGWKEDRLPIDIIPLFETVDDLQNAGEILQELYDNKAYRKHLNKRNNRQTIMLGFSDGTKDGGYLMANWAIYKAKEDLSRISQQNGIDVIFFDGRGGPPARGGGKTHKFYASMGKNISNKEIQLTVQGQTVSSNFGTQDASQYNIEQLLNAGISNDLFSSSKIMLSTEEEELFIELSQTSFEAYNQLKEHPDFMEYLIDTSPLKYYSETNIASRPSKRRTADKLQLKDLRAIPYVGAWSQIKQNVTGYYGLGTALQAMDKAGKFKKAKKLYRQSLFLKTLLDNCEMVMKKTFFPLTQHLSDHPRYGEIWNMIHTEYELTKKYILKLSGKKELMQDYPVERVSIEMRERIVMPLTTIQQYAIAKRNESANKQAVEVYEKLIIRSSFGIINAARNSA